MTSPITPDAFAAQMAHLAAGNRNLVQLPQAAFALTSVGATEQQTGAIDAFLQHVQNQNAAQQVAQAQNAGLTAQGAIDAVKAEQAKANKHTGFSGFLWHATHNPVVDILNKGQNLTNAALTDVGALTEVLGKDLIHGNMQASDNARKSDDAQMLAAGYDPNNPFSVAAFWASGQARQDLSDLQSKTDQQTWTNILRYTDNPDEYVSKITNSLDLTPDQKVAALQQINGKEFQDLAKQVSARSATVGHYLFNTQSTTGKWLAFSTDLLAGFKFDPVATGLTAARGVYLAPVTLARADDMGTVYRVLTGDPQTLVEKAVYHSPAAIRTRQGFQFSIDQSAKMRQALADNDLPRFAALDAEWSRKAPDLYRFKREFTGADRPVGYKTTVSKKNVTDPFIWQKAEPITSLEDAAEYFGGTMGLARMRMGLAPEEFSIMPGRLSVSGARQLRAALAYAGAKAGVRRTQIDLRRQGLALSLLPTPADNAPALAATAGDDAAGVIPATVDSTPGALPSQLRAATPADIGDVIFARGSGRSLADVQGPPGSTTGGRELTGAKGTAEQLFRSLKPSTYNTRMRRLAQRWSSTLNRDDIMTTTGPDMDDKIFKYGQIMLPRGFAHLLQGLYSLGDEGARKGIMHSLAVAQMHAAGFGTTVAGKAALAKFEEEFTTHAYGVTDDGRAFLEPSSQTVRDGAIWDSQLQESLTMPSMRELLQKSAKMGIWENTIGASLNGAVVSTLTDLARIGWVFRAATAVRAVQEDLASVFIRGKLNEHLISYMAAKRAGLSVPYGSATRRVVESAPWRTIMGNVEEFYRKRLIDMSDPAIGAHHMTDFPKEIMDQMISDYSSVHMRQMMNPDADIVRISRGGFNVRRVQQKITGYGPKHTTDDDGSTGGAQAYSAHLKTVFGDNPQAGMAMLDHIDPRVNPELDPNISRERLTDQYMAGRTYGKYTRDGIYRTDTGVDVPAATDFEKRGAALQHIQLRENELKNLLYSADGRFNATLADHIRETNGNVTADWITENIPNADRPRHVLGAIYEPVPKEPGLKGFVSSISNAVTGGYARLVEAPIARWSVQPQLIANFNRSMAEFQPYRDILVGQGMSEEHALAATQNLSLNRAWHTTMRYVDDPTIRDQLDIVGKAFFGFSRATTQFIRRWGRQLIEDPARARRLMLTYEAAQQSGFIYTDSNGQEQFIFPGSGIALRALSDGMAHLGIGAYVPALLPNLGSRFAFLNPALQNPFSYSLTPIGNIPLRAVEAALPGHREMLDSVDTFLNGQISSGESFGAQLVPTVARNFYQALSNDDRNSMLASATNSAVLQLEAAGQGPPANADSATIQLWRTKVRAQVKNQLLLRAIFAFGAPAAPSEPTEEVGNKSDADPVYKALGIRTMKDEYRLMINQMGIEEANVVWAKLHPDKLMYEVPETEATEKGGYVAATSQTLTWLRENKDFMSNYSGVAAYFIPPALQQGPFDIRAYNAELELGLRQHKTTEDYFNDVASANASQQYFTVLHERDKAIAAAPELESSIRDQFSQWAAKFGKDNPIFAANQPDYGAQTSTAKDQLAQLARLASDPNVPKDVPRDLVRQMVDTYNAYHSALQHFPTQSNADNAGRAAVNSQYNQWWNGFLTAHYEMGGVYTGVFRSLDNKVLDSLSQGT